MSKEINADKIKNILISFGINEDIFLNAEKMDLNITKIFCDKLINDYSQKTLEEVTRNLLGVYGNYIATQFYKGKYKKVLNEVPILDDDNNEITRADISFFDLNGKLNYVEVKATEQIIDYEKSYVDSLEIYDNKKEYEIMKYKMIGKKLIEQVKKLSKDNINVIVAIFEGCHMDDIIKEKLNMLGIKINIIDVNIYTLIDEIKRILTLSRDYILENNIINIDCIKQKNEGLKI